MRTDPESLMEDLAEGAHRFLGGRFSVVVLVVMALLCVVFVYQYGERTPSEQVLLLESWSAQGRGGMAAPLRAFTSVFLHRTLWQLAANLFILYLFLWFALRRLGQALGTATVFVCAATTNFAASKVTGAPAVGFGGGAIAAAFFCTAYFPYLRFFRGASARWLAPALIVAAAFANAPEMSIFGVVSQTGGLTVALGVFLLEPRARMSLKKWWLHRQVSDALSEAEDEEQLDRVLTKVSRKGMAALSRKERNFLMNMSRRYRRKVGQRKE